MRKPLTQALSSHDILKTGVLLLAGLLAGLLAAPARGEIPIRGWVNSADGAPLAGARASLHAVSGTASKLRQQLEGTPAPTVVEAKSKADGAFLLRAPDVGMWEVRLEAPGKLAQSHLLTPLLEATELPVAELGPSRALEIQVRDPEGAALRARVAAYRARASNQAFGIRRLRASLGHRAWQPTERFSTTDESGLARLSAGVEERLVIRVAADGFPPFEKELGGRRKLTVEMLPGPQRDVRVVDSRGRPFPGVLISDREQILPLGRSDDDGRWTASLGSAKSLEVLLMTSEGHQGRFQIEAERPKEGGKSPEPMLLALEPALRVRGRVVEAQGRAPLPGALVWADPGSFARAGRGGDYELSAPAGRKGYFQAAATGYVTTAGTWSQGEGEQGPTLALHSAAAIEGRVIDHEGRPLVGVLLEAHVDFEKSPGLLTRGGNAHWARPSEARSRQGGAFRIGGLLAPASYELVARRPGFAPRRVEISALEAGESRHGITVELLPGRTAFGQVVDLEQLPVAGAQIQLQKETGSPRRSRRLLRKALRDDEEEPLWMSDAEGRFSVPDLDAGRYVLEITASGYAPVVVPGIEIPEGLGGTDVGTVVLVPGLSVEGRVVDSAGQPVAGASIDKEEGGRFGAMMAFFGDGEEAGLLTGADGHFSIDDLREGERFAILVWKAGYVSANVPGIVAPSREPLEIVLQPAARVEGQVVDEDRRPVGGAMVLAEAEQAGGSGFRAFNLASRAQATSDDNGRFVIDGASPGLLTLSAVAEGFQEARLSGIEAEAGGTLDGIELVLREGAVVEGTVRRAGGAPLEGAMVRIESQGSRPFMGSASGVGLSDAEGRYRLSGVAQGMRSVVAQHEGGRRVAKEVEVRPGKNVVDLVLEAGVEVSGRVVDESGSPVPGVRVFLSGMSRRAMGGSGALTDGQGEFTFEDVSDGRYRVGAEKEGYALLPDGEPVEVAGGPVAGIVLRLGSGATLKGRISGLDFDDLAVVQVFASGNGFRRGTVDHEASYSIPHLGPGEWRVRAEIPGSGRQAFGEITIEDGLKEASLDLDFGSGFTLTGRVLHGGEPVRGAYVSAVSQSHAYRNRAETDHEGVFRLEGLESGTYKLSLQSFQTGLAHEETVEVLSDREILIDIETGRLSGFVRDSVAQEGLAGVTLTIESTDGQRRRPFSGRGGSSDSRGYFSVGGVPAGSWRLTATAEGYVPAELTLQLGTGESRENLELALEPAAGVTFAVRAASGEPLEEAWVAVLGPQGQWVTGGRFSASEGGRVRISTVPAGSWSLVLQVPGGAAVSRPITAPGDQGQVLVPMAGHLRLEIPDLAGGGPAAEVRLIGSDGRTYQTVSWQGRITQSWSAIRGSVLIRDVAVGLWTVEASAADGRTWNGQVSIAPGATAELALR